MHFTYIMPFSPANARCKTDAIFQLLKAFVFINSLILPLKHPYSCEVKVSACPYPQPAELVWGFSPTGSRSKLFPESGQTGSRDQCCGDGFVPAGQASDDQEKEGEAQLSAPATC